MILAPWSMSFMGPTLTGSWEGPLRARQGAQPLRNGGQPPQRAELLAEAVRDATDSEVATLVEGLVAKGASDEVLASLDRAAQRAR